MWLPECAYRPTLGPLDAVRCCTTTRAIGRAGVVHRRRGVTHFFVDTHLITDGQPMGMMENGNFRRSTKRSCTGTSGAAGGNVLEPVGVVEQAGQPKVFAFARHPRVSEQVW